MWKFPELDNIKKESERILGRSLNDFKLYEVRLSNWTEKKRASGFRKIVESREEREDGTIIVIMRKVPRLMLKPSKRLSAEKQLMYVRSCPQGQYSEFNFGSGESSVIRMVADIESQRENALVLIEEIENGLHPLAVSPRGRVFDRGR